MKRKITTVNIHHIVLILLILSFVLISYKTIAVAISERTDGINLTEFTKNRNTEKDIIKATRGDILSSDGELLATNVNSYTVAAWLNPNRTKNDNNPQHVVDKDLTASKLSEVLNMDKDYILSLLNKNADQVELGPNGRGISELTKKEIEKLDLPGIFFIEGQKRFYPMSSVASHTIGYARSSQTNNTIKGWMGIEQYYDKELQGKDGYTIYQKDAYGYVLPNTTPLTVESKDGKNIELTIDSKLQLFVENGIKEIMSNNNMDWMNFSIMDAKTGAIVATSSNLNFNLNTLDNIQSYLNPLTSFTYEPGSTMKIFSFLAAMEEGVYNGSATYKSGTIEIDDATIKDFNNVGWGTITYDEGFAYSSNVAASYLALSLGKEKLYNFYSKLGFGKKTGITLPEEYAGDIDFNYRVEQATASFGQGITTTPIQNLQALTILTNNGTEIKPYIVEKIWDKKTNEITYQHKKEELGKKVSEDNVKKMLSLMYDVVYSGKTDASFYKTNGITLIGKTGTAQITGSNGKYMNGPIDYIRSFAGIFPYEDPQYILYVSVKRFDGKYRDFAKMVTKVVEEISKYKNITELKENIDKSKIIKLDNYISKTVEESVNNIREKGLKEINIGNGDYVIDQFPKKGTTVLKNNKVFLITNGNQNIMPNIIGWSSSEVITLCKLLNLDYKTTGRGFAISQSIEEGTIVEKGTPLEITFQ